MDPADHLPRRRRDDDPYLPDPASASGPRDTLPDTPTTGYTLMVAGRRTGKTSFLRLLLDTSNVVPTVTKDQLASVAKFVHGCSGHTSHVRSVSVDVELAAGEQEALHPLTLTLIDTPSLDFDDEPASQRTLLEILRHVDSRFAESMDDDRKASRGDHHVHLCIYFLDPDYIVPPSVSAPPAPVPRARTDSLSKPDPEPVILEPPVTTNPLLCRPTLPPADIVAIRRLSARVNVLPVIACADMLTNDRLAAVKMAIRRDLAEAGIGFGIFDVDTLPYKDPAEQNSAKVKSEFASGYGNHMNGSASMGASPPSTPISPSFLRLPFALISPDIYSHSDGVSRSPLSRHELAIQYAPSTKFAATNGHATAKIIPGKFIRSYRWGHLDVMDVNHCDFLHLRGAIFHHMKTLQKYTREYLFEKFRAEFKLQASSSHHTMSVRAAQSTSMSRLHPLQHGQRPVLAIDTAPSHTASSTRHPSLSISRSGISHNGEIGSSTVTTQSSSTIPELSPKTASSSRSQRQRTKKITVACNFCRSRKLKCDGGRPACSQCFKRSNACDYMTSHKRRGAGSGRQRKMNTGSESDCDSADDPSGDADDPSLSPEVVSQPSSRRNSSVSMLLTDTLPPLNNAVERRDDASAMLPPIQHATSGLLGQASLDLHAYQGSHELPPIATLSAASSSAHEEAQSLPPIRTTDSRRRTSSTSARGPRQTAGNGSKIVACNYCRARKTRCDGAHPTCGSCQRRSLPCNYVNDPSSTKSRAKANGAAAGRTAPASSRSSPTTQLQNVGAAPVNGFTRHAGAMDCDDSDVASHPNKKMRVAADLAAPAVPLAQVQ